MSKKHLKDYVDQKNWVRRMFKRPELDVSNLSAQDVQDLLESIEGDLSPENLCCDGELRGAALRRKAAMINGARTELERMAVVRA
jgi:hypothetical protein